jgi:hypothetical protein
MQPRRACVVRICTIVSLVTTLGTGAIAAEVTLKNDSFQSGGPSIVVGDFVAGERAAARFTSPCDGAIVAVQIAWLADPSTGGQSIEDSIIIYDAPSFPMPGGVLEVLEAPVLTDGAINEFRFLDENNAVPLNVPVTQGQQFVVALQFFNPTNVNGGSPSVIEDTDGCQGGKNLVFASPGLWANFCSFGASGDFVIRAVVDCDALTGACCLPDGSCDVMSAADCSAAGGTYQGDLTDCLSVSCPPAHGACCFEGGGCLDMFEPNCAIALGTFQGPGTDCASTACFPVGACCLPDGSCDPNTTPGECDALGGTFQGDGTGCGTVSCPEPKGACCFDGSGCLFLTQTNCTTANGSWLGLGTDCTDGDGSGVADDCESPPCPGDLDGDSDVDLDDATLLLQAFGNSPAGDIDGDGDTDLDDLTLLLQAFGSGCS